MLNIQPHHELFIAIQPIDFRKGIDGIAALCRQQLQQDAKSGAVFLFRNKKANAIKILVYDGQGFWLCQKRLSSGSFKAWPTSPHAALALTPEHLHVLVYNNDPQLIRQAPVWRSLPA